jgi:hypothetical protein
MNNEELSQALMDELAASEKNLKVLRVGGVILVLFLVTYLQFIYGNFKSMAEPKGLADIGALMLEEHASEVVQSLEKSLANEAPGHVRTFYQGMTDGISVARVSVMDHMRSADSALARQVESWLGDYFETLVKENPQMQLAATRKQAIAKDAFVGLSDQIRSDLEMMFEAGGVDRELEEASAMISGFADRLERYASGIGLGSDEREERALLHAWINLVAPDFVPTDEPLDMK